MARLAERFTVIRYDKPGCGLSDRDGIDLSFDGQVAAALAVADAARAGRFSLFGGAGAQVFVNDRMSLYAGYRLVHVSNGNTSQPNRGFEAHTGVGGLSFYFK